MIIFLLVVMLAFGALEWAQRDTRFYLAGEEFLESFPIGPDYTGTLEPLWPAGTKIGAERVTLRFPKLEFPRGGQTFAFVEKDWFYLGRMTSSVVSPAEEILPTIEVATRQHLIFPLWLVFFAGGTLCVTMLVLPRLMRLRKTLERGGMFRRFPAIRQWQIGVVFAGLVMSLLVWLAPVGTKVLHSGVAMRVLCGHRVIRPLWREHERGLFWRLYTAWPIGLQDEDFGITAFGGGYDPKQVKQQQGAVFVTTGKGWIYAGWIEMIPSQRGAFGSNATLRIKPFLKLPMWSLALGFSALLGYLIVPAMIRRRRWLARGRCGYCGYMLQGLRSNRCPECGEEFETTNDESQGAN